MADKDTTGAAAGDPPAAAASSNASEATASASTTAATDTSSSTGSSGADTKSEIKAEPSLLEGASAEKTGSDGAETETKSDAKDAEKAPADAGKDAKDSKDPKDATPSSETKDKGDGKTPAKAEAKDGEKTPAEPGKDAAVEKPPAQVAPHAYEAFTVPDGTKLDDKQVTAFTGILNNAEYTPQQRAQALVDMHVAEVQRVSQQAAQHQRDVWTQMQNRWKDDFRADKEIGGNRAATSLGLAKSLIEEFGGSDEDVKATLAMLSYTGAGNHVGLIRVLHNAALALSREGEPDNAEPPNPAGGKSRQQKWYGDNGAAKP
jgi:hypothetical protein